MAPFAPVLRPIRLFSDISLPKAAMRLALFQPDIPQNCGTLLRLAACLGIPVDLIEPFGFLWDDKRLRRAGLDYAVLAQVTKIAALIPEDWCRATNPVLLKFADLCQQLAEAEDRTDEQRKKLISLRLKLVP